VLGQGGQHEREVAVAADHARHRRPEVRRRRELVPQHQRLQLAQCGAGLEAELAERPGQPAVGRERVGVAAGAVEREHQVAHRLLAQRVLGGQRLELRDGLVEPAGRGEGGRAPLPQRVAQRVQPPCLRLRGLDAVEVGERLAAPQGERFVARRERPRFPGQLAEAPDVDGAALDREPVAGRLADQHLGGRARRAAGLEERPQPREPHAQRPGGAGAPLRRPRRLDQLLRRHRRAGVDEQPGEQRALDRAGRRPSVDQHRSECGKLHGPTLPPAPPGRQRAG
jgi:hypothetical protein